MLFRQPRIAGACLFLFAASLSLNAQVRPRITRPVTGATIRLGGTTHPLASAANEVGRAPGDLPMERMLLQLSASPDQEAALAQLLEDQNDPSSPRYHQWLTPEQFGEQFGPAQADVDAVKAWLASQGFAVTSIAASRRVIEFSGMARQVERAFGTEMRRYNVNGVEHVANSSDISIPEALSPVVSGVVSLHNFEARPLHRRIVRRVPPTDLSGGSHGLSPFDFAAIYDLKPLWNLSYDGTGQTVAVAGRTNINLNDVATFRSTFGLSGNNTQVVVNGANPGIVSSDDETEADLDVEWAGAVAKGATIKLVVSMTTNSTDGVDLSNQYIVNNNLAAVVTVSFGVCEAQTGSSNSFYNSLWQQAAAQGMSVFVATGDSGSAGCDLPSSTGKSGNNTTTPASQGFGVNALASTPYNVAVGGSEFNDASNPAAFWNSSNDANNASAIGYIPEVVWNESSYTTAGAANNGLWAGGGGVSRLYATPSWQTGAGVPAVDPGTTASHHRYLPDVSLTAAGHDGYLVYQEGQLELVGGTSASTPSFAGLMAVVDQYTGGRNGNPNTRLYPLAASNPAAFHDVTGGTNAVPCAGGSLNCSSTTAGSVGTMTGYSAAIGYDLATGLGSVDAYALALQWSNAPVPLSITSLSPNPITASSSSQTLTINGTGFVTGATVRVSHVGLAGTAPLTVTSVTATQIQATINTGTSAQTWTVQVVNPGGTQSNTMNLTVSVPVTKPVITSVSSLTASNTTQTLTITGTGFTPGAGLRVVAGFSGVGSYYTVLSATTTQIQVQINPGRVARTWLLEVIDSNGAVSNVATFQVQ